MRPRSAPRALLCPLGARSWPSAGLQRFLLLGLASQQHQFAKISGLFSVALTADEKQAAVVALCLRPASAHAVAEGFGVSHGSLYQWKNQLLGHDALAPMKRQQDAPATSDRAELEQQVEALRRDIRRLQLEKALLRKANELLKKNWASIGKS